jgi:hypothetical protein
MVPGESRGGYKRHMQSQFRIGFRSAPAWPNPAVAADADPEWSVARKLTVIGTASAAAWLIWGFAIYSVWSLFA